MIFHHWQLKRWGTRSGNCLAACVTKVVKWSFHQLNERVKMWLRNCSKTHGIIPTVFIKIFFKNHFIKAGCFGGFCFFCFFFWQFWKKFFRLWCYLKYSNKGLVTSHFCSTCFWHSKASSTTPNFMHNCNKEQFVIV